MPQKLYSSSDARVNKRLRQLVESKRQLTAFEQTIKNTYQQEVEKKILEKQNTNNTFNINNSNRLSNREWIEFISLPTKAIWKNTI